MSDPSDPMPDSLDQRLETIARHPFRAKFHLRGRDRATAELSGPSTMRWHAYDLIAKRLAPAEPYKDGKQTPYRGHPCSSPSMRPPPAAVPASSAGTRSPRGGS
nr:DUF4186 family protein [Streptomyces antimycoticus]